MAIYNEILVGRYAKGLQRLFGMKGDVPTKQLSGELIAVHPIFNGAENRFLEGWSRFFFGAGQNAVAAQFATFQLRNPATSNVIAVVEKINISSNNSDAVGPVLSCGPFGTDLATVGTIAATPDARVKGNSSLVPSQTTLAAVTNLNQAMWSANAAAGFSYEIILNEGQQMALSPGQALRLSLQTVNIIGTISWFWRERVLEPSETI